MPKSKTKDSDLKPIIYDHYAYFAIEKLFDGKLPCYEVLEKEDKTKLFENTLEITQKLNKKLTINPEHLQRAINRVIHYERLMVINTNEYQENVKRMEKLPQHVQKSKEWLAQRATRITMSDYGTVCGLNGNETEYGFILKKCGKSTFKGNKFTEWGVKYEPVAQEIQEIITKMPVIEFGMIPSEEFDFLGASPDGISFNGLMVEIKCPYSRKIGAIPEYYWCQVQGQMRVCGLVKCDFLECEIEEITKSEYASDTTAEYKGVIIQAKGDKPELHFRYSKINIAPENVSYWIKNEIQDIKKDYHFWTWRNKSSDISYWRIRKARSAPIYRDDEWFEKSLVKAREVWERVKYYKKYPEKLIELQQKNLAEKNNKEKERIAETTSDYFNTKSENKKSLKDHIEEHKDNPDEMSKIVTSISHGKVKAGFRFNVPKNKAMSPTSSEDEIQSFKFKNKHISKNDSDSDEEIVEQPKTTFRFSNISKIVHDKSSSSSSDEEKIIVKPKPRTTFPFSNEEKNINKIILKPRTKTSFRFSNISKIVHDKSSSSDEEKIIVKPKPRTTFQFPNEEKNVNKIILKPRTKTSFRFSNIQKIEHDEKSSSDEEKIILKPKPTQKSRTTFQFPNEEKNINKIILKPRTKTSFRFSTIKN
jgi:putative phage-type endonuclease